MADSKVVDFYANLEEAGEVIPVNQLGFDFDEEQPEISNDEAKKIIIECVKAFSGEYGKSGICKILAGSRSIENNPFHLKAYESQFFGALKGRRQKAVTALIDELTEEGAFRVKHIAFGRPVLCAK